MLKRFIAFLVALHSQSLAASGEPYWATAHRYPLF